MIYLAKDTYLGRDQSDVSSTCFYYDGRSHLLPGGKKLRKGIEIAKKNGFVTKHGHGHKLTKLGKAMINLTNDENKKTSNQQFL
jgi:hypothetical protein